jgi:hypothetical protein
VSPETVRYQAEQFKAWHRKVGGPTKYAFDRWARTKYYSKAEKAAILSEVIGAISFGPCYRHIYQGKKG